MEPPTTEALVRLERAIEAAGWKPGRGSVEGARTARVEAAGTRLLVSFWFPEPEVLAIECIAAFVPSPVPEGLAGVIDEWNTTHDVLSGQRPSDLEVDLEVEVRLQGRLTSAGGEDPYPPQDLVASVDRVAHARVEMAKLVRGLQPASKTARHGRDTGRSTGRATRCWSCRVPTGDDERCPFCRAYLSATVASYRRRGDHYPLAERGTRLLAKKKNL